MHKAMMTPKERTKAEKKEKVKKKTKEYFTKPVFKKLKKPKKTVSWGKFFS